MSKDQKIRIGMTVCAVVVVVAVILAESGIFSSTGLASYANAEKYTAGPATISENVRNLDIGWVNGSVTVAYHQDSTVLLEETANRELNEDTEMRWWLDGDTLRVQYAKPGLRLDWNLEKHLTLTLPEGTELGEVQIGATSADLVIPEMKAENIILETTSGDVKATAEAETVIIAGTSGDMEANLTVKKLEAGTTSGSLNFTLTGTEQAALTSTSGSVRVTGDRVDKLDAGSTSGRIEVTFDEMGDAKVGNTSGGVTVRTGKVNSLDIGCTSGEITAALPAEPGFTLQVETTSGDFNTDMSLTKNGDIYTCGDGSARINIGATSGNVRVEAWQK